MGFFSRLFKKKNKENIQETKVIETQQETKKDTPAPIEQKSNIQKTEPTPNNPPIRKKQISNENKKEIKQNPRQNENHGFFEIKKSKDDRYVFNLYASNKVIVATSQIYSSVQSALNGINSVIANAETANVEDQTVKNFAEQNYPKWEIYKDKGGDFRFRLSASNGSCICHSQGYTSKANCKKGIESIIKNSKTAQIEKSYLKKDK